jgi:hypothetical protein
VKGGEGSWKEERAIVQSVTNPNGGALPSHPSPRVMGEVRRVSRLEKWEAKDTACLWELSSFLFPDFRKSEEQGLFETKNVFNFVQAVMFKCLSTSTIFRS